MLKQPNVCCNHSKTSGANHAGRFQSTLGEVVVGLTNDLLDSGKFIAKLRGDHADQPIVMPARADAKNQSRTQLPDGLVCLWKGLDDDLTVLNHRNDSFTSSIV